MKYFLMGAALMMSTAANSAIHKVDIAAGAMVQNIDGMTFPHGISLDVNSPEITNIKELKAVINIDEIDVSQGTSLDLMFFGDAVEFKSINNSSKTAVIEYINPLGFDPKINVSPGIPSGDFVFDLIFDFFKDGANSQPGDFLRVGEGSYIEFSDTTGEIFVPETGTFALFLLGAVGLCVRRQMKQQA